MKYRIRQWIKMIVQNLFLPCCYTICAGKKIVRKRVILADAHHKERPVKLQSYYERFVRDGYEVIELYEDYQKCGFISLLLAMFSFMKWYASAEYVLICDNFLPVASCHKKKQTKVIQVWHGCGAFKKFGYDSQDDIPAYYKGNVYRNYSLITVSGPQAVAPFASAMKTEEKCVLPIGVGYTDCYFDESYVSQKREQFYQLCPNAKGKKLVLWAPTFRGTALNPYVVGQEAVAKLQSQLGEDYYVMMKLHPHMKTSDSIEQCEMAADELLPFVDLLITDYSSILFLYSIFCKPMVLFAPDYETYMQKRGFYLTYDKLPATIVKDEEQLCDAVCYELEHFQEIRMQKFYEQYMGGCDGKAMDRLVKWMRENEVAV